MRDIFLPHRAIAVVALLLLNSAKGLLYSPASKVAVTGGTGKLGRAAVQLLSSGGTPVRVLSRHDVDASALPSCAPDATAAQVTAYYAALPNVELVKGDATDAASVARLLEGCGACLALHGATRRRKLSDVLRPWIDPSRRDRTHARSVNFESMRHVLAAMEAHPSCRRVVRVTGKGETPWSLFSILINGLGSMAKAWNYAGETLLREASLQSDRGGGSYTIVRPGVMRSSGGPPGGGGGRRPAGRRQLVLADNGADLAVAPIAHADVARLCIECLEYENAAGATLTAMTIEEEQEEQEEASKTGAGGGSKDPKTGARRFTSSAAGEGDSWGPLLASVSADTRAFPRRAAMLREHHRAVRVGGTALAALAAVLAAAAFKVAAAVVAVLIRRLL